MSDNPYNNNLIDNTHNEESFVGQDFDFPDEFTFRAVMEGKLPHTRS